MILFDLKTVLKKRQKLALCECSIISHSQSNQYLTGITISLQQHTINTLLTHYLVLQDPLSLELSSSVFVEKIELCSLNVPLALITHPAHTTNDTEVKGQAYMEVSWVQGGPYLGQQHSMDELQVLLSSFFFFAPDFLLFSIQHSSVSFPPPSFYV